jgi:hypothetical protein
VIIWSASAGSRPGEASSQWQASDDGDDVAGADADGVGVGVLELV